MKRLLTLALLFAWSAVPAMAQAASANDGPLISFFLPHGFPSEKVELRYFLSGPFGGYGGFVESQPDRQSVDLVAAVDGKPAVNVKVIAFISGCEISTFDFAVTGTAMWRQLECRSLKTITLRGHILPSPAMQGRAAEVEVRYEADWSHAFFGIMDGMVPTVRLSRVTPTEDGDFAVDVPDFQSQGRLGPGGYSFFLRESHTGNFVYLVPQNASHLFNSLTVNQSYPSLIRFSTVPPNPAS